jgi:hypothetical protein
VPKARGKRARKLEKIEELDLPAEEFIKARRKRARESYDLIRPQIEATGTQIAALLTETVGKQAVNLLRSLRDPRKSTWEWMTDVVALGIEDWAGPAELLMRLISANAISSLKPSKHLRFDLDQASQASDPQPIEVGKDILRKIRNDELEAQGLKSRAQSIPAENIRLSVKGQKAFVSLVDLANLGRLNPAEFSGAIKVNTKAKPKPATGALTPTKGSAKGAATKSWVLGTAHTKITEGPG